ncbi:hypothetical protein HYN48_10335 [Flavobacterium magnum]|uniref:histidine kinase n=1 Tax=Flavobacterium magnum TaxID=2162713 RepID=A0A2S0RH45_9FLAO|nr:histidine kinase [Flavobacterium magnum]AWA30451.1 hypothetical protein HYN48_10335 [Flavobacterium magnum]
METQEVNTILWIGTSVSLFFGGGLIFLVLFYQNHLAKIRREEAEMLLKTSLQSEKNERKRIAADIHDGLSGDLNAARNFVAILQSQEADDDKVAILKGIHTGIEAALQNTRSISYKLMPPLLESSGLIATLKDYFDRLNTAYPAINFRVYAPNDTHLETGPAYEVLRIIQEFSTNMIKYGNISQCAVTCSGSQSTTTIEIVDDGTPYHFESLYKASNGAGLGNIRSRLKILDAAFQQKETAVGNHFLIVIKTPV